MTQSMGYTEALLDDNLGDIPHQKLVASTTKDVFQITPVILSIKNEIKKESSPFIQTAPFFAFEKGYLMSMRVYLNGYGSETEGIYVSAFIHLMKGPYDDELEQSGHWPLRGTFTVELLSPSYFRDNYKETFLFSNDICTECTNRVMYEGDMAKGYGGHFISLDYLYYYCTNETLHFRVSYSSCNVCAYLYDASFVTTPIAIIILHAFVIYLFVALTEICRNLLKIHRLAIAIYIFEYHLIFQNVAKDAFRSLLIAWILLAAEALNFLIWEFTGIVSYQSAVLMNKFMLRLAYIYVSSKAVYVYALPHANQTAFIVSPLVIEAFISNDNIAKVVFLFILIILNLCFNVFNILDFAIQYTLN